VNVLIVIEIHNLLHNYLTMLSTRLAQICPVTGMAISHIYQVCARYGNHTW